MFLKFYGLREQPFGVTPDPRFLFQSRTHREALASLQYGIQSGRGFIALLAEPGLGKTTLLFELLQRLGNSSRTAFLFQTQSNSRELMGHLLADLELNPNERDPVRIHEQIKALLVKESHAGRRVILVIDEAQNLDPEVLETIRLLSNFETPSAKLLQIILSGQPPLSEKLSSPALAQLRQRIGMTARLQPLAEAEVPAYIHHRLRVARYNGPELFSADAMVEIARVAGGVPRNINNVCFNALSLTFAMNCRQVEAGMIAEVASDFDLALALSGRNILEKFATLNPLSDDVVAAPAEELPSAIETPVVLTEAVTAVALPESTIESADVPGYEASAQELQIPVFVAQSVPAEPISPARVAPPMIVQQTRAGRTAPAAKKPSGIAVGAAAALAASSWTVLRSTNSLTAAAVIAFACIAVGTRMLVTRTPRETSQLLRTNPTAQLPPPPADETASGVLPQGSGADAQAAAGELHTGGDTVSATLEQASAQTQPPATAEQFGTEEANPKRPHPDAAQSSGEDAANASPEPMSEPEAAEVRNSPPAPGTEIAVVERDHPSSDVTVTRFFNLDPSFYPEPAREQHVQGIVVLRGTINESGVFSHVRALKGDHRLVGAAIKAVTNRQFDAGPSSRGKRFSADLTLEFRLPKPAPATQTAQAGGGE